MPPVDSSSVLKDFRGCRTQWEIDIACQLAKKAWDALAEYRYTPAPYRNNDTHKRLFYEWLDRFAEYERLHDSLL